MAETDSYILFDIPTGKVAKQEGFLKSVGHPVKVCHGPGDHVCPLIEGNPCPLAEGAHGIVFELDLDRPEHREVLDRYKAILRDDLPIGVSVRPGQETEHAELLKGLKVWTHTPVAGDLDGLAAGVDAADMFET